MKGELSLQPEIEEKTVIGEATGAARRKRSGQRMLLFLREKKGTFKLCSMSHSKGLRINL